MSLMATFHFGPSRVARWVGQDIYYPQCVKIFQLREQKGLSTLGNFCHHNSAHSPRPLGIQLGILSQDDRKIS